MEGILIYVLGAAVSLALLYVIINTAVIEALKAHTRWQVANRDEIEAKYAKRT